jgi:predicted metal-dependent phosphoesterase TrpH
MSYKTELHCHKGEVSDCATETAEFIADRYAQCGYSSVVITNHLSIFTFDGSRHKYSGGDSWEEKIAYFMNGVDVMKKAAAGRFNVLWGVELRCEPDGGNDYLIYGVDVDFLLNYPDILYTPIYQVAERVHEVGGLIYQAHPFRNGMRVKKPVGFDGVEVYNGHVGHDSRNPIAMLWAETYGLKKISGSDFHHAYQTPTGGIITEEPIFNNKQLVSVLKNGNYTPLHAGELPVQDK